MTAESHVRNNTGSVMYTLSCWKFLLAIKLHIMIILKCLVVQPHNDNVVSQQVLLVCKYPDTCMLICIIIILI